MIGKVERRKKWSKTNPMSTKLAQLDSNHLKLGSEIKSIDFQIFRILLTLELSFGWTWCQLHWGSGIYGLRSFRTYW